MKKSEIVKLAKQGHHQAIALLLNHSLKARGIQATVGEHANTLHILLESQDTPSQATYSRAIHQGLQKLDIATINKAHIYGRAAGHPVFEWKTVVSLRGENAILDESQFTQPPSPPPTPSPAASPSLTSAPSTAGLATQTLKPGWGFWCGWMMMSLLGSAIAFLSLYYFESRLDRSYGITKIIVSLLTFIAGSGMGLLVGWGQASVLRREFPNSHPWIIRTAVGTLISTTLGFFWAGYYRAVPTWPNAIMFWLLMGLPIVACQWTQLRQKIINAWLWLVVPSIATTAIGLTLNFALPDSFNLLDAVVITRWLFYAISGGLMIWLLRDNANVVAPPTPSSQTTCRQILQQRSRFNYLFVLEWLGLTVAGWFAGQWLINFLPLASIISTVGRVLLAMLQGLPPKAFVFTQSLLNDLPNVLSLVIWFGLAWVLQWLTLRRRLDDAKTWLTGSCSALAISSVAVLLLKATAFVVQNWEVPGNALAEPWPLPSFFEPSLPGLIMATLWGAGVLAQAHFWQRQKCAATSWLMANLGALTLVALLPISQDDLHLLAVTPFVALALPAFAIAWMVAYAYPPPLSHRTTVNQKG